MNQYSDKTYILMCEKSKEIQKLFKPQDGDFIAHDMAGMHPGEHMIHVGILHVDKINKKYNCNWFVGTYTGAFYGLVFSTGAFIWLPRQDQLQGMIKNINLNWFFLFGLDDFTKVRISDETYYHQFTSMEQLWLAFVMKEKYNKIWDGNNWIKGAI